MDPEKTTSPEVTEDQPAPPTFTSLGIQVKGRPPSEPYPGDGDDNGGDGDDDCDDTTNTIATGTNPFTIMVTTDETSSATITFTYGQGTTTFADADLPTYFTDAPTSTVVTALKPNANLPFSVITIGTIYWVQASGSGITSAQIQFKRTV